MKYTIYISQEDKPYIGFLKSLLPGANTLDFRFQQPVTLTEALLSTDAILTTTNTLLKLVTKKSKCTVEDYIGSFWLKSDPTGKVIPILCLPPLKRLVSTKPGVFLFKRFLSKITRPETWSAAPSFHWTLCDDDLACRTAYNKFVSASVISIDIETSPAYLNPSTKENPQHIITCVSYTACTFHPDGNNYSLDTIVIPCTSFDAVKWIRLFNQLPQPKIFQNGKYDNLYFLRYGAPVKNWLFDTLEAHHCLFAELPKDLAYQAAFYIRTISYWKDEGKTGNLEDFYRYNGQDSWATCIVFLTWLREAPAWAIQNYLIKFPLVFPCLACEVDGLSISQVTLSRLKQEQALLIEKSLASLRAKIGIPNFNPSSPKQVLQLIHLLGCKNIESSDEASRAKAADKHPLNRLLLDEVTNYREASKLTNTYLNATLFGGKLLYSLNPSGTDTGRLASRESALWCGTQLQNLPSYYKQCIEAEEGFMLGEGDFSQSETFCTAFLSGDKNLIAAVSDRSKDFHATNASSFFGLSYQQIMDEEDAAKKQMVRPFTTRDLSKRVNHGSNYNMGPSILLATMGMKNVLRAKSLLKLAAKLTPIEVCAFLLLRFNETYPQIKNQFYSKIIADVRMAKMLVSQLGWTRLCFGKPWQSKPDLNSYVAHVPSNLSVGIINEAFLEIFLTVQLPSLGAFRLKGQIHDSILFAYKEGRLDLVQEVEKIMTRPKQIVDCMGVERTMTIPVEMKAQGKTWNSLRKLTSEQERKQECVTTTAKLLLSV